MNPFCLSTSVRTTIYTFVILALCCAADAWPAKAEASFPDHGSTRASYTSGSADYQRASRALPQFCREWEGKLRERVKDQPDLMEWQDRDGWKTATYRGYGPIESCTCKLRRGVPVGEITYKTIEYYLAGHTVEQARHAQPIVAGSTNTIEIVRWNDGQWVYK